MRIAAASMGPGGYKTFSDIPAHKLGRVLRGKLYQLTKDLPKDEAENLVLRIKKAATTMTASLVTGFGEGTPESCIQGALNSRGALMALQDHLDQLQELSYLSSEKREQVRGETDAVIESLNAFLGELSRQSKASPKN